MSNNNSLAKQIVTHTTSMAITSGTTSASSGDLAGTTVVGLYIPTSLASTALTFTISYDGTTYVPLKDISGATYTLTVGSAAAGIYLDASIFAIARYIKVITGSSETSKTFVLITRPV